MEKINSILSLFDGISCGQIALNRAGIKYDKYFASEIDKHAIKVTQTNWPATIQLGSVIDLKAENLPKIDLIFAGFCCQSFSSAGHGLGFEDPRGQLFFEFVRILKEVREKNPHVLFVAENVRMKKVHQDVISKHLGVEPILINSAKLSAQNRLRNYWTNIPNVVQPEDKGILLKDIIEENVKGAALRTFPRNPTGEKRQKRLEVRKDDKANCITTHSLDSVLYYEGQYRKFTTNELEELQTIDKDYTSSISNSQRLKCLGNCWTVDIIAHILKGIKS